MDNKQKKKIISLLLKNVSFLTIVAIVFSYYLSIKNCIVGGNILWLDIVILSIQAINFVTLLVLLVKVKHLKNLYNTCKTTCLFLVIVTFGIIVGLATINIENFVLNFWYYFSASLTLITQILCLVAIYLGYKVIVHSKNSTIIIDSESKVPNYDDELMLKKQLDELNRKMEMKKVTDEIENLKKQLDE